MDQKSSIQPPLPQLRRAAWPGSYPRSFWVLVILLPTVICGLFYQYSGEFFGYIRPSLQDISEEATQYFGSDRVSETIKHHLTLAISWRNLDGGYWRPVFTGNDKSPIATIEADEGDILEIVIQNENLLPISIHWFGMHHKLGRTWFDGSSGVTQSPILPRGNRTIIIDTEGNWGLRWFGDHTTTPAVDGLYGTIWIRPNRKHQRPYKLISDDPVDIQNMMDAEHTADHLVLNNWQHKPMDWLLAQLQSEGYNPYCFKSILANGKGRVHCKPDDLEEIDGNKVDANGCVLQKTGAVAYDSCTPSNSDYEIIETRNRRWMMLNIINPGLEHPYSISIDDHDMWVVANDAGFVTPQKVQVLQLNNAQRFTVMIKLDQEPADYAIRFYALSRLQSIQGYAVLRYPHHETGRKLGDPMPRPSEEKSVINLDGTLKRDVTLLDKSLLSPYPRLSPPAGKADITLRFRATGAADPYNPYVTNCSLNGAPWQVFRVLRTPLYILGPHYKFPEPNPIVTGLPLGSIVDIIVDNEIPEVLPMYKHNDPVFRLGAGPGKFEWADVADAERHGVINLHDPPRGYLHDQPANGWLALRWRIDQSAMTMFHVLRLRYFVLGMQVPMFEGDDHWPEVPDEVKEQPRVNFELPEHMGIFD
ncbi:Cupredoxin [Xylaria cubensis]|nr:Cupredoxin [Xylaria cubensis]